MMFGKKQAKPEEMEPKDMKVEIPDELPVLVVSDKVPFPYTVMPHVVVDEAEKEGIRSVLGAHRLVLVVPIKEKKEDVPITELYNPIGVVSGIMKMATGPMGEIRLLLQGIVRAKVVKVTQTKPFHKVKIEVIHEPPVDMQDLQVQATIKNVHKFVREIVQHTDEIPDELAIVAEKIEEPGKLADFVASNLPSLKYQARLEILNAIDPKERISRLLPILSQELNIIQLAEKIRDQVQTELGKTQREYLLRQQLQAIKKELGEAGVSEVEELRKKIEASGMPEEAKKVAFMELEKLERLQPGMPGYEVSRTYIDWLIALPWDKETEDNLDIERAKKILDEDHYDLDEVKERILEFLAVRKVKQDMKGPILCFVGPPGVGKTSLGKSIARALGRKFVRFSLGGVRDEAEIRGHRRTYIGALPGRIIQGIRKAGVKNPVFMLDEIDKIGADFRGDPAAALLEALDPEQNDSFSDHYLEVPFDLSKVMFITTANVTYTIPPALLDRMEIIHIPGYVPQEKLEIARHHIIPKQMKEHGLTDKHIQFTKDAIMRIITEYTREAGVRELERAIAACCRKVAKEVAAGKEGVTKITKTNLVKFLGPPKYFAEVKGKKPEIGVVTGLSWTPTGGEIMFIEAVKLPGKKNLILTGRLGEVLQESAKAAYSYVRSILAELGVNPEELEKYDVHIHIPGGAIPKDGPSAGVAIATALASLFTEVPVDPGVAMTGEITLRGKVLPVGGIREKVLAAKNSGIKKVILPKWNKNDLEKIPDYIKQGIEFKFVDRAIDAIKEALLMRKRVKQKEKVETYSPKE